MRKPKIINLEIGEYIPSFGIKIFPKEGREYTTINHKGIKIVRDATGKIIDSGKAKE